ncbi:TetR/AcrR family transcriptional regulator [Marvinbryantia formatexigens]|nr:TetR/AcrR family transcriptional regulator [Marvinbryantia formatexigens]UWO24298.1 TetR/AcrR family transcriptional regulator [Marvinbryantia formatexigens DSM 14469]SDF55441.1 transcriptional regulator, TetR family [Marvinbryantia formatexigens]
MEEEKSTLERIHEAAKRKFLEKGFQAASLRNIVKRAGVTTGAFYGYYDSKEELFAALVDKQANYVLELFCNTIDDFEKLPGQTQTEQMTDTSVVCLEKMLDYIYDNYDAFKLLIECAEGTAYADFVHQLVVREVDSTFTYIQTLAKMGCHVEPLNKNLIHIIASALFSGIFEVIVHDMPKEEAREYISQFHRFYTAGWSELLNVKFGKS